MFTLHAEHEMNCSTAAARHLASSGVDVYTAIAGAPLLSDPSQVAAVKGTSAPLVQKACWLPSHLVCVVRGFLDCFRKRQQGCGSHSECMIAGLASAITQKLLECRTRSCMEALVKWCCAW